MTITDQIKILNKKIMQNEAQYDLDRKAAKTMHYLFGLKPNTIEQARFKYSSMGEMFNKNVSENDKTEGLFKRLENIEGKTKSKNKKESEPIKNEEQSKIVKDESTVADKKSKEIVLLKDKLHFVFGTGKKILKKLAKDLEKIDYNNLLFEIDDKSVNKHVDFLKEIVTLYDLFIYLRFL